MEKTIACNLSRNDFKKRYAKLKELFKSLKRRTKESTQIVLTFEIEADPQVRYYAALEQECCPFAHFEVNTTQSETRLIITSESTLGLTALWDQITDL